MHMSKITDIAPLIQLMQQQMEMNHQQMEVLVNNFPAPSGSARVSPAANIPMQLRSIHPYIGALEG